MSNTYFVNQTNSGKKQNFRNMIDLQNAGLKSKETNKMKFGESSHLFPAVDISETDKSFLLRAELAGFAKNELEVIYENDKIVLRGYRKKDLESVRIHKNERFRGKFERHFFVSEKLDPMEFRAKYRDGILTVLVPKDKKVGIIDIPVN